MRTLIFPLVAGLLLCAGRPAPAQSAETGWSGLVCPDQPVPTATAGQLYADDTLLSMLDAVSVGAPLEQLEALVRLCVEGGGHSAAVGEKLTDWLRENHPIYQGKSATEAIRLRSFMLASLAGFPANESLRRYVTAELRFSDQPASVTAAARTARVFAKNPGEMLDLLCSFLQLPIDWQSVDISTCELAYPLKHPVKLPQEILATLRLYGAEAYPALRHLQVFAETEKQKTAGRDTAIIRLAELVIAEILEKTPVCCRHETPAKPPAAVQALKPVRDRARPDWYTLRMIDQYGDSLALRRLKGKPFVLTFFYTRCSNPMKCAATVERLAALQKLAAERRFDRKIGIFGLSYDAEFDGPSQLLSFGRLYGMSFSKNARLLAPAGQPAELLSEQLGLRVSYGYGGISQHGIQLFVFDKKGRIAAVYDNDLWQPEAVLANLIDLSGE